MKIINYKDGTVSIETSKTDDEIKAMSNEDLILEAKQLVEKDNDPLVLMMIEFELKRRNIQIQSSIDENILDEFESGLISIGEMFRDNLGGENPSDIAKKVRKMFEEK